MAWTGNGDAGHPRVGTAGCWGGGFEEDVALEEKTTTKLLAAESKCVSRGVLAPSPTHELDVRGRGLAVALAARRCVLVLSAGLLFLPSRLSSCSLGCKCVWSCGDYTCSPRNR